MTKKSVFFCVLRKNPIYNLEISFTQKNKIKIEKRFKFFFILNHIANSSRYKTEIKIVGTFFNI